MHACRRITRSTSNLLQENNSIFDYNYDEIYNHTKITHYTYGRGIPAHTQKQTLQKIICAHKTDPPETIPKS